jgi:hypothetical protein
MSKFFFKRKKKEKIEPAESGTVSEAELLKDVQKMQKNTMTYSKEAEAEYRPEDEKPDTIDWVDKEPEEAQELGELIEEHPIATPIISPPHVDIRKTPIIEIDADNLKKELKKWDDKENDKFPDVMNKISMSEMWIDATPDAQYALRILRAYRQRCDEKWMVEGFSKERRLLYDAMNAHQERRAKELDQAIALLEETQK